MEEGSVDLFGDDFKQLTLDWAASVGEGQPLERIEFFKRLISLFTQDELRRAKGIIKNKRRDVRLLARKIAENKLNQNEDLGVPSTSAVSSSAVRSLVDEEPEEEAWFDKYLETPTMIVAVDAEFVSKPFGGSGKFEQHIATFQILDLTLNEIYSHKVYHAQTLSRWTSSPER